MKENMTRVRGILLGLLLLSATPAWTEGLLWKTDSRYQAKVVPPYTGQPSPFPLNAIMTEVSSTGGPTLEEMEAERVQEEIVQHATRLIGSPQALVPYMEGTVVGGLVEGANGRKILINNDWIGTGMDMNVRLMASDAVKEAINKVSEFNPEMAKTLKDQLAQRLRQTPATKMKLKEIRSDALVLSGEYGQQVMKIIMR